MLHNYAYVAQVDYRDCGVAALATIAKHYGSTYSLAYLRSLTKTDMNGTTALGIVKAAEKIGFSVHAVRTTMELFKQKKVPYPFIAHIVKNHKLLHFVVVYKETKREIIIADPDPKDGIHKESLQQFSQEWDGVAIFIAPSPHYHPRKEFTSQGLWSFIPLLLRSRRLIGLIILAAGIVTIIDLFGSYYLQAIIDTYIPDSLSNTLGIIAIGLIIAYAIQQVMAYARGYLLTILGQRLVIDVNLGYVQHVYQLPMSFFSTRRTGEIISRFTDANEIINAVASTILSVFLDAGTVMVVGIVMGFQNINLLLLSLAVLPIYTAIILVFIKPFEKMNNDVMQANALASSSIIEDINGIETIKSLASEQERYKKVDHEFVDYLDKSFKYSKAQQLQTAFKSTTRLVITVIILLIGANYVMHQKMSVGQLVTFDTLLGYFTTPLLNIINLQSKLQSAKVASHRLNEVFLVKPEISKRQIIHTIPDQSELDIQDVSYRFGYGKNTLSDINLSIHPGEKVAIAGMSGSGKTTLAKLLVGFYEPTKGTILIDGMDIRSISRDCLRHHILYVPQQPCIFSGSVLENLTLGAGSRVTPENINKVCQLVEIQKDIEEMPLGIMTDLTTDATALSGGQKQRIALARALLTDDPIMILDEATSSLDMAMEKRIISRLLALTDKTIIFIAHRLEFARNCSKIIVLSQGKIIEQGTHQELMESNGEYARLILS